LAPSIELAADGSGNEILDSGVWTCTAFVLSPSIGGPSSRRNQALLFTLIAFCALNRDRDRHLSRLDDGSAVPSALANGEAPSTRRPFPDKDLSTLFASGHPGYASVCNHEMSSADFFAMAAKEIFAQIRVRRRQPDYNFALFDMIFCHLMRRGVLFIDNIAQWPILAVRDFWRNTQVGIVGPQATIPSRLSVRPHRTRISIRCTVLGRRAISHRTVHHVGRGGLDHLKSAACRWISPRGNGTATRQR